jgi:UDP-3-O-[3-hydroxymyristoyl] glucosamine N-acyltransferase
MTRPINNRQGEPFDFTLKEIARIVRGEIIGDDQTRIRGINSLDLAGPGEISFLTNNRFRGSLAGTSASAVILQRQTPLFNGPQVIVANPELSYARLAAVFAPDIPRFPGVSDRSFCHESCSLGKNVSIYPNVYIEEGAAIGEETVLFPGVYIGGEVKIGSRTIIYPNVAIMRDCRIGNDVIIHAGTVIGSDGFGFVRDGVQSIKIPQLGVVQIDDRVEIGANNCIDRAAFGKTWIKSGVKTDNLVQVAHNVTIGEDTVVVAQTGISGSVKIGRQVIMGGQVGIADHLEVGDGVMIAAQSGVAKSIPPGQVVSGTPTMPHRTWLRTSGLLNRLPEFNTRIRTMEKRLEKLEKQTDEE